MMVMVEKKVDRRLSHVQAQLTLPLSTAALPLTVLPGPSRLKG
jgi:hypothetical protein